MTRTDHREWHLAGDERAGVVARRSVNERHRATLRLVWRPLLVVAAVTLAGFAVGAALASGPLLRGVLLGTGLAIAGASVCFLLVLASGTAPLMAGGLAETWTADTLRPLREHGWRLVNHVRLTRGDLDHVLVGPGGLVLIETKWRSEVRDVDGSTPWSVRLLEHVAADVRRLHLWHRAPVAAVVAVWGPAARDLTRRRHDATGVVVMPGEELQQWMLGRGRDELTEVQVDAIYRALDEHVAASDRHAGAAPPQLSVTAWAGVLARGVLLGLATLLALGYLIQATALGGLAGVALTFAASEFAARRTRWRYEVRAAQLTGAGLLLLAIGQTVAALA